MIIFNRDEGLKHGGVLANPSCIVLHYTAGPTLRSALGGLQQAGTSAHFIVDLDGSIYKTVPTDLVAYHAGISEWRGRTSVNSFSIGIEIVNFGQLTRPESNQPAKTWTGASVLDANDVYTHTPDSTLWAAYPEVQRQAVGALCGHLLLVCPSLKDIVGHSVIAPRRKIDPGPAFSFTEEDARALLAKTSGRGGLLHTDLRQQIL